MITGNSKIIEIPRRAPAPRIHRRRSPQSVAVSLASRFILKNTVRAWAIRPDLGWPFESVDRLAALLPHTPVETERVVLDDCAAEWVHTPGVSSSRRAIVYLHGGAFMTGGLNTHRSVVTRLAAAADAYVLNIDYRMLPVHRISEAIGDGVSGLRWLLRRRFEPDSIVVAGDSAGGYLAFMATLAAIRERLPRPAGIATISPFTDANPARKLNHRNARRCALFPHRAMSVFTRYLSRERIVSPVDSDLTPLPPVAIHASTDELLLPDAEAMAERLDDAGVRCDLHLWEGQIHDFPVAADVLPEGRRAIRHIGDFVREVTEHENPLGSGEVA